jgi:hypothetical protein
MTITNPAIATTAMGRTSVAVCSNLRRREVIGASSLVVLDAKRSGGVLASRAAASGGTSGGAMTSSTSASGAADLAGWVGAAPLLSDAVGTAAAPASTTLNLLLSPLSSALAKSRHRRNLSLGSVASARAKIPSKRVSSGLPSPGRGGDSLRCLLITTAGFMCAKGGDPVRRWNAVHAKAY